MEEYTIIGGFPSHIPTPESPKNLLYTDHACQRLKQRKIPRFQTLDPSKWQLVKIEVENNTIKVLTYRTLFKGYYLYFVVKTGDGNRFIVLTVYWLPLQILRKGIEAKHEFKKARKRFKR